MKKLRIYLDTSVINFLFADDAPEKRDITIEFFEEYIAKNKFSTFASDVVIEELERTKDEIKREKLISILAKYNIGLFYLTEEAILLSEHYLVKGIIPKKKVEDARHIAISTINECDVLVSWNYQHLANVNKERWIHILNTEAVYNYPLKLTTPLEVMGE